MSSLSLMPNTEDAFAILPYEQRAYQESYSDAFIAEFNHNPLSKGPVDSIKVNNIVCQLNAEVARRQILSVYFDQQHIVDNLTGGSCSAIALKIAKVALDYLQGPGNQQQDGLLTSMAEIVKAIHTEGLKNNKTCSNKRKELRSIQAAFNTICVDPTAAKMVDICQDKIKALATFYDIGVSHSTEELQLIETKSCLDKFESTRKNLEPGVYFLRVIQKEGNQKLEKHGHSTVYVKSDQAKEFYFDTQLGLYDLSKGDTNIGRMIFLSMCSAKRRFNVDSYKFHKLHRL